MIDYNGGTNANFIKSGNGTLRLSNTGNTANITVVSGSIVSTLTDNRSR